MSKQFITYVAHHNVNSNVHLGEITLARVPSEVAAMNLADAKQWLYTEAKFHRVYPTAAIVRVTFDETGKTNAHRAKQVYMMAHKAEIAALPNHAGIPLSYNGIDARELKAVANDAQTWTNEEGETVIKAGWNFTMQPIKRNRKGRK